MSVTAGAAHRPSRSAFSLAEAALAILILLVAYLPLSDLLRSGVAETVMGRNHLVARQLALAFFEQFQHNAAAITRGFPAGVKRVVADCLADPPRRALLTAGARRVDDILRASAFKMKVEIDGRPGGMLGLSMVTVTVTWDESGRSRSRQYARLVAR